MGGMTMAENVNKDGTPVFSGLTKNGLSMGKPLPIVKTKNGLS
jgi:hypothetical protein